MAGAGLLTVIVAVGAAQVGAVVTEATGAVVVVGWADITTLALGGEVPSELVTVKL